jgi:hypothetical protein
MALSKIQAESMNLADTYAFTGTVTGTPSDLVKLNETTISDGASSVEFTSILDSSTYKNYLVIGNAVRIASDNNHIRLQVSNDNGSSYVSSGIYQMQGHGAESAGAVFPINQSSSTFCVIAGYGNMANYSSNETTSFELWLMNPTDTATYKHLFGHQTSLKYTGGWIDADFGGQIKQTTAYNAFKLFPSAGNFRGGVVTIFGVK